MCADGVDCILWGLHLVDCTTSTQSISNVIVNVFLCLLVFVFVDV